MVSELLHVYGHRDVLSGQLPPRVNDYSLLRERCRPQRGSCDEEALGAPLVNTAHFWHGAATGHGARTQTEGPRPWLSFFRRLSQGSWSLGTPCQFAGVLVPDQQLLLVGRTWGLPLTFPGPLSQPPGSCCV